MAADPPVSPADTIRPDDLREAAEYVVSTGDTATAANMLRSAADVVDALLSGRERDRRQIEQLTEALFASLRAVLADKEDAE